MSKDTNKTDTAPEGADDDVQSDPARDTESEDWGSEGGATPDGPATDTEQH